MLMDVDTKTSFWRLKRDWRRGIDQIISPHEYVAYLTAA
jgi:hypothetical protein